jgi:hypothetical protein
MHRLLNAAVTLALVALSMQFTGCAARQAGGAQLSSGRAELPRWVRVVEPEKDGRYLFVGGVSFAADLDSGIEAADADARSQVHLKATRLFTDYFNEAVRKGEVETTPIDRLDLKNSVTSVYGNLMAEKARQDTVFYRPCGGDGQPGSPAEGRQDGPVCQIFVLVSLDGGDWNRVLGEVLAAEKRRRVENGQTSVAEFIDAIMHDALEKQPEEAREQSR